MKDLEDRLKHLEKEVEATKEVLLLLLCGLSFLAVGLIWLGTHVLSRLD